MECSIEIKRMDNEDFKLKKYYFKKKNNKLLYE